MQTIPAKYYWALTIALIALTGLAGWLATAPAQATVVDIGDEPPLITEGQSSDFRNFYGFNPAEKTGERTFRWTSERGTISFPNQVHRNGRSALTLELCACRTDEATSVVTVTVNDRQLGQLVPGNGWRHYTFALPDLSDYPTKDILVDIQATSWVSPDQRTLGVAVSSIGLVQIEQRPAASIWGLLLLAGAGAAIAFWKRSLLVTALLCGLWLGLRLIYVPQLLTAEVLSALFLAGFATLMIRAQRAWVQLLQAGVAAWLIVSPQILGTWMLDDSFISFRYAQNFVQGNGLVFNPGERVEGYTNFLWTLLISAILRLGADPIGVSTAITLLLGFGIIALSIDLSQDLIAEPWRWLVAPLVALSTPFLLYTTRGSGMETALFTAGILATLRCTQLGWWVRGGLLTVMTLLTRPDGIVLAGVVGLYALWTGLRGPAQRLRPALRYGLTIALLFGPYWIWRWTYYGYPLPNTFYVKVGGTAAQLSRGIEYMRGFGLAHTLLWTGLLGGAVGLVGTRRPDERRAALLLCATAGLYCGYVAFVGGDWMPGFRFGVSVVPLLAILTAWGLATIAAKARLAPVPAAAAGLAIIGALGLRLPQDSTYNKESLVWYENDIVNRYREIGRWIKHNTDPQTMIVVSAAGVIPYYSERPTIDALGLNDEYIAHIPVSNLGEGKAGHEKVDPDYVMGRRPEIIPWVAAPYFTSHPDFDKNYRLFQGAGQEGRRVQLFVRSDLPGFDQ